ncbi:glycosyltransferase family 4 protein [Jatrophihabitans lederbergiae]|uniref:Glycosyltransferase family 4 protein n=1 Tax=Jatrophihabitans lederbergiae TaxID=3075547 RepID=A0ABU2J856_9ACTN|nr:glycosyltransferase family 4 protein [Jatrophihabitans sp. DSM 44399]MDT0261168.1 glycosyltransferase family 4 protein [Jatrophihabitans sp. DSM 44399]
MRIGMVCPYLWDIPGGVQAHVRDLAETLIALGHEVSVLAPGEEGSPTLPSYVVAAGKTVPIPYNGSVARLQFGLVSATRVRRWLRQGNFDVVHVHEPAPPSLSLLTVLLADVPLVATFHAASTRSRFLAMFDSVVQAVLERLSGRIAVSQAARKMIVEHLGADAVVIPNGVSIAHYADAAPLPGYPRDPALGGTIGFIGRYDESRKGMAILIEALTTLVRRRPGVRLLVAGRGEEAEFLERLPEFLVGSVVMLGMVSERDKASLLRSVDVYVAPNTGGESFGIILLEAMAARTPIVASDLQAFRRVLDDGRAGLIFRNRDAADLAAALDTVLGNEALRGQLAAASAQVVQPYDWAVVASQIMRVYEIAVAATLPD